MNETFNLPLKNLISYNFKSESLIFSNKVLYLNTVINRGVYLQKKALCYQDIKNIILLFHLTYPLISYFTLYISSSFLNIFFSTCHLLFILSRQNNQLKFIPYMLLHAHHCILAFFSHLSTLKPIHKIFFSTFSEKFINYIE